MPKQAAAEAIGWDRRRQRRWLGRFGSSHADHRAGPNRLLRLLNRHGLSELGSLAPASAPERSAAAKSEAGCPHPQHVEQALEQAVEQPVEQPLEQPLEQPVEQPLEQDYGGR